MYFETECMVSCILGWPQNGYVAEDIPRTSDIPASTS